MYSINQITNQIQSIPIYGYAVITVYVYPNMIQGKLQYFTGLSPVCPYISI